LNLIGGAQGIDGGLNSIYNFSSGVIGGVTYIGDTGRATKMVWYSPTVSGFQVGFAYTPNTSHNGDSGKNTNKLINNNIEKGNAKGIYFDKDNMPYGISNFTYGVSYTKTIEKWSFGGSVTGVMENSRYCTKNAATGTPIRNANSYQITANLGYDKWAFAAGWIDNRKSRLPKDDSLVSYIGDARNGNAGKAWNVGGSYTIGAYQFATGYFRTDRKTGASGNASSDIVTFTADLNALQGLKFFGEVDLIQTKTNDTMKNTLQNYYVTNKKMGDTAIGNNSGAVVVVGTKVSF
jgi:hypothetical protein